MSAEHGPKPPAAADRANFDQSTDEAKKQVLDLQIQRAALTAKMAGVCDLR